ncbi:MAG: hypothetical protein HZC55_00660 [Verrucomicrobia bacterium]|nr:hypothetical protein [Verrucomicrobiota bacterium]
MKPATLLLFASLLANLALVAVLATRPSSPPPAAPAASASSGARASAEGRAPSEALRAALLAGNARELEAAGLPADLARELALGRSLSRLVAKYRADKSAPADKRWWRSNPGSTPSREQQLQLRREMSDALVAAFGEDAGLLGGGDPGYLAFLSPAKREALRRINQDYEEMMAKFGGSGIQLPSDREKLKLLRAERDRDIAAVLTPEEQLQFELRTSPIAGLIRARYGDGIETEEDFRKIYALQKAFEEKFPTEAMSGRINPETLRARNDAQRQLQDDIRAALGDTAYANLRRASDGDLRTVEALASRLNLAAGTTDRVATLRENLAAESQRINADASVPLPQRRAQIQELGTRARAELQQALGSEAADAYSQRSPWVGILQSGLAYSTTPPANSPGLGVIGGQSVYPVMPAGAGGAGGTRQMVVTGATLTTDGAAARDVHLGGTGPVVRDNVQVMTFTTSTTEGPAPAVVETPGGQRTIIVAPPSPPPAPPK